MEILSSQPTGFMARYIALVAMAASLVCSTGCVQRRMVVRSNPPGAVVYIDDYEIGTTPVATNFTYYGTRKIRLVKNGYETLTVMQPIPVPWYEFTPLDFFTENLVPGKIHDTRTLDYQLVPQLVVPSEQLLDRAEGLRRQSRDSGMVRSSPPLRVAPPTATGVAPSAIPRAAAPSSDPFAAPSAAPFSAPTQPDAAPAQLPAPPTGLPPSAWPPAAGQ